jgi:hypothetical protein
MHGIRTRRALITLICALICAGLLLCLVADPAGSHFEAVLVPVLCLFWLLIFEPVFAAEHPAASQPLSFLSIRTSRAPPLQ